MRGQLTAAWSTELDSVCGRGRGEGGAGVHPTAGQETLTGGAAEWSWGPASRAV